MGCDIHPLLEGRGADGKWRLLLGGDDIGLRRWYGLFGWLAGVRSQVVGKTEVTHKGLPPDMSKEATEEADYNIEHSPHWADLDDLLAVDYDEIVQNKDSYGCLANELPLREFLGSDWMTALGKMRKAAEGYERVRFIFGFDS